jgi:molecular chaperone DnaK (HSP70)
MFLLLIRQFKYHVLVTNGDTRLGGENYDNLLKKYCLGELKISKV